MYYTINKKVLRLGYDNKCRTLKKCKDCTKEDTLKRMNSDMSANRDAWKIKFRVLPCRDKFRLVGEL